MDIEAIRKRIISRIVRARTDKGMTQAELARLVGTQPSNISRLESGRHNPSLDLILKVADALELQLSFMSALRGMAGVPGLVMEEERDIYMADGDGLYELRIYDTPLVTFRLEIDPLEGLRSRYLYAEREHEHLLPLDLDVTDEGILEWLRRRVIPKNRTFIEEILESLGLKENDTKGIIDVCMGLSLNDSYWVVPRGFDGKFADYNLYENRFSEALSLIAYTGYGPSDKKFSTSPELTTGGMLPKGWRMIDGDGVYLYKGGTSGFANTGNEPYSEFYASQVAEAMRLNAVHYDLEKWKGILASKCRLFTDIDTAYVPIGRIVQSGGLKACLDFLEGVSKESAEAMRDMLVFDAVVYNEDRHYGNFGVLRDNLHGDILGFAPLFDHGMSLFNFGMQNDFEDLATYAATRGPAYRDVTFESICSEVMGLNQRRRLRHLFDFTFKRHGSYNLPEWRLKAIEKHLRKRARDLVKL